MDSLSRFILPSLNKIGLIRKWVINYNIFYETAAYINEFMGVSSEQALIKHLYKIIWGRKLCIISGYTAKM